MSLVLVSFTLIYRAACPLLVKHSTINLSLTSEESLTDSKLPDTGYCHEVYGPPPKSSPHIAFVWGTNISEFLDPPSNSAKAKAWARARARVETRPRANARARVRDRIRERATELGLEGGNNF